MYESMVVLYLMTSLPPIPKIELDDEKEKREKKRQIYGSALVPSMEALCLFKEQLASSRDVLTVCARMTPSVHSALPMHACVQRAVACLTAPQSCFWSCGGCLSRLEQIIMKWLSEPLLNEENR